MTQPRMIEALFAHGDWARDQVLSACDGLTDDALDRPVAMGPGSLRKTLRHLWEAERIWLNRWTGKADPNNVTSDAAIAVGELRKLHDHAAAERTAFVRALSGSDLDQPFTYTNMRGDTFAFPIGDVMSHVCNHGVHHRAQALNMLRSAGGEPPMLDYLKFKFVAVDFESPAFDVERIRRYFAYGDWAMRVVRETAEALPAEKLDQPMEMGVGSLRKTLLHIYDAEHWWLLNWTGEPPDGFPEIAKDTSPAALREHWGALAKDRNALLCTVAPARLAENVEARFFPGKPMTATMGDSMLQLFGHGTHHRAQAVNMIRRLGGDPPRLDYVFWLQEGSPV